MLVTWAVTFSTFWTTVLHGRKALQRLMYIYIVHRHTGLCQCIGRLSRLHSLSAVFVCESVFRKSSLEETTKNNNSNTISIKTSTDWQFVVVVLCWQSLTIRYREKKLLSWSKEATNNNDNNNINNKNTNQAKADWFSMVGPLGWLAGREGVEVCWLGSYGEREGERETKRTKARGKQSDGRLTDRHS